MITQTSRQAYKDLKPFLSGKRREIYEFLLGYPQGLTRNEIERLSEYKFRINSVCGRVDELLTKGYCKIIGFRKDKISGKENEVIKALKRLKRA